MRRQALYHCHRKPEAAYHKGDKAFRLIFGQMSDFPLAGIRIGTVISFSFLYM